MGSFAVSSWELATLHLLLTVFFQLSIFRRSTTNTINNCISVDSLFSLFSGSIFHRCKIVFLRWQIGEFSLMMESTLGLGCVNSLGLNRSFKIMKGLLRRGSLIYPIIAPWISRNRWLYEVSFPMFFYWILMISSSSTHFCFRSC